MQRWRTQYAFPCLQPLQYFPQQAHCWPLRSNSIIDESHQVFVSSRLQVSLLHSERSSTSSVVSRRSYRLCLMVPIHLLSSSASLSIDICLQYSLDIILSPLHMSVPSPSQVCRGYGYPWINPWIYPWIYPCVDMRLRPWCGYIHGYCAGTPANYVDYFICFVSHSLTFASFYRAMHFSAYARSWDRMSSVCSSVRPPVCDVGGLWSHKLEILETNCTDN